MRLSKTISDAIRDHLVPLFDPKKIIVFGSYATETETKDSDIDILVLVNNEQSADRNATLKGRIALRRALFGKDLPFDLIVETIDDFNRYCHVSGSIQHEIDQRGMVLYEH